MDRFKETQRFINAPIFIIVMLGVLTVILFSTFGPSAKALPETSVFEKGLPFLVVFIVLILFISMRLETEVNSLGVTYRFFPIIRKPRTIPWNEITQAEVRKYQPIREYGGWGLKGLLTNKAVSISGNKGLQLHLASGRKLLIGTQKPKELEAVLAYLKAKGHLNLKKS